MLWVSSLTTAHPDLMLKIFSRFFFSHEVFILLSFTFKSMNIFKAPDSGCGAPDLEVMSRSPTLGVEKPLKNKILKQIKNKSMTIFNYFCIMCEF